VKKHITYQFGPNKNDTSYTVVLNNENTPPTPQPKNSAVWTTTAFHHCDGCINNEHCPLALSLQDPIEKLKHLDPHQTTHINVYTEERNYQKETTIQEALGSLYGLIIARSGCHEFNILRDLSWFHLPFATMEESLLRFAGRYLLHCHADKEYQLDGQAITDQIKAMFENFHHANNCIVSRLNKAEVEGVNLPFNAVTQLDSLGGLVLAAFENHSTTLQGLLKKAETHNTST